MANNRYTQLIETIFFEKYTEGAERIEFERPDLETTAKKLNIVLPKNLGDIIYSFKFRTSFPQTIINKAPFAREWVIKNIGRAKYAFVALKIARIIPDNMLMEIKIPDSTPGIVTRYALGDEQALLAKLRYSRILDVFTGIACYSLQNHLRTTVPLIGQVETDEIYVGVDKNGKHYVFPVQAKGGKDELGIVQIEQDIFLCRHKYPSLICKPIAAQFMGHDVIAIFEFALIDDEIKKVRERHYKLVSPENISEKELESYKNLADNE
jgi:hypothetical protein